MKLNLYTTALVFFAALFMSNAQAQTCTGEIVKFTENFGSGNGNDSLPAGRTNYHYNGSSNLAEGDYRLDKNTQGSTDWHNINDHTGDNKGHMMIINASFAPNEFYRDTIQSLTPNNFFSVYLYIMNITTSSACGSSTLLPQLQFIVDVSSDGTTFNQLNSFTTAFIPQTATPTWVKVGGSFTLPLNATYVRYRILNSSPGGCGNDFAIDDITFSQCASIGSGLLPVTGLKLEASQKGADAQLNWSTYSEINSHHFDIEKSSDGSNWNTIATIKAAGNSNSSSYYNYTDKNIAQGTILYRLKEVDIDGKYLYSSVVTMKAVSAAIASVKVSAYPNPFVSSVGLELTGNNNETVFVRMMDQQGKTIKQQSWNVQKGFNSTSFTDLQHLPSGIYFMSISNTNGESIYTGKLLK